MRISRKHSLAGLYDGPGDTGYTMSVSISGQTYVLEFDNGFVRYADVASPDLITMIERGGWRKR